MIIEVFLFFGHNWARLVIVPISIISMVGSYFAMTTGSVAYAGNGFQLLKIVQSLIWVFYFTRPGVVAFFKGQPSQTPPV